MEISTSTETIVSLEYKFKGLVRSARSNDKNVLTFW